MTWLIAAYVVILIAIIPCSWWLGERLDSWWRRLR